MCFAEIIALIKALGGQVVRERLVFPSADAKRLFLEKTHANL